MLTKDEVRHVAKLARLALREDEVEKFTTQLTKVLDYVEILKEVNTDGVPETSQVTGLQNVLEKDEVVSSQSSREELLGCSELPIDSKQVRVLPIIK
jgi:aspartyl-tRNA(Asn)/glutamyl-tRNA(Gln) amidotransferase subunit C